MPLTRQQWWPYVLEVQELSVALLACLDRLEAISQDWQQTTASANTQLADEQNLDLQVFDRTMSSQVAQQTEYFALVESFLAGWARLSLLFYPIRAEAGSFTSDRATGLRNRFGIAPGGPLEDRDLRNSWMHFDERLDDAVAARGWNSRQRFVRSSDAPQFVNEAVRVLEMDTLRVHYRGRDGVALFTDLRELRAPLAHLREMADRAFRS